MHNDRPSEVEFFFRRFSANGHVLMPRFETESLVRRVRTELKKSPADVVVDVWTGSGIIAISLACEVPGPKYFWLDISGKALETASSNAKRNGASVEFLESDLLSAFSPEDFSWKSLFFAANLPYIRSWDPDVGEDVALLDPHLALYGWDETGFECIERFLEQSVPFAEIAKSLRIALEFGHDQTQIANEAARRYGYSFESFADLSGIERFWLLEYVGTIVE